MSFEGAPGARSPLRIRTARNSTGKGAIETRRPDRRVGPTIADRTCSPISVWHTVHALPSDPNVHSTATAAIVRFRCLPCNSNGVLYAWVSGAIFVQDWKALS